MFKTAAFLQLLPHVMRPMMAKLLSKDPAINRTLLKYLEPIIQERIDKDEQLGVKREGKPVSDRILAHLCPPIILPTDYFQQTNRPIERFDFLVTRFSTSSTSYCARHRPALNGNKPCLHSYHDNGELHPNHLHLTRGD